MKPSNQRNARVLIPADKCLRDKKGENDVFRLFLSKRLF
jgi:hypothetical protein